MAKRSLPPHLIFPLLGVLGALSPEDPSPGLRSIAGRSLPFLVPAPGRTAAASLSPISAQSPHRVSTRRRGPGIGCAAPQALLSSLRLLWQMPWTWRLKRDDPLTVPEAGSSDCGGTGLAPPEASVASLWFLPWPLHGLQPVSPPCVLSWPPSHNDGSRMGFGLTPMTSR